MSLKRNGIFSAAEVIVSGLCLFLIYRQVASVLGVSMLGVWGLVLSTTAFGRAADLGVAGGLSRFVARALGENDSAKAVLYMRTGVAFMTVAMGAVVLLLWWPLWCFLDLALNGSDLAVARSVLPWAVLSIWLLMIKSALDSCLIGVHRADLRSVAGIAGMVLQVGVSVALIDDFALRGLAWAQAGQFALAISMEVAFLMTVARVNKERVFTGSIFSKPLFKEMLGFGVTLQFGSLGTLMFEPVVKSVLGAVAGTYVLGIFEMAYRASYQVKNVATMALQPTIPLLAELALHGGEDLRQSFRRICKTASVMTAVLMSGLALASPLVSWALLGYADAAFIFTTGLMSITWAANVLAAPSYYLGIAMGQVWPYVTGEFLAAAVAAVAVFLLGSTLWPWLAVLGILCGKVVGSAIPATMNRPSGRLCDAAITDRWALGSLAIVVLVGGFTAGVAGVAL